MRRKDLREMMLKLNDVCDCDEQLSWIIWVCAFCFLRREEEEMTFLDRRLDVCCLDGCDFGVVCYCCWNRIGLATVISVEDVQSDLWQSDQAVIQNCCVCAALKCSMFDGGWTLLLNCCSQHSLFIVKILIIGEISISFHDVSNYLYLLCSELVNEG